MPYRYLNNEDKFKNWAFDTFTSQFNSQEEFERFYRNIPNDDLKEKFLKIASLYKFLIQDGVYVVSYDDNPPTRIDYLDNSYKFIALISLIEHLMGKEDFVDFYAWINKNHNRNQVIDEESLKSLYEAYKEQHGCIKKFTTFFQEYLSAQTQKGVCEKVSSYLKTNEGLKDREPYVIEKIAQELYQIRSDFIHNAELVVKLDEGRMLFRKSTKIFEIMSINMIDMKNIFKEGFISYWTRCSEGMTE